MEETGSGGAQGLSSFVGERHAAAAAEVAEFDGLMERKLKQLPPSKLKDIAVVVGIPFYTEVSNIISVLVTLREVFQERRQRCLVCVVGECARSDYVQMIDVAELEEGEAWEQERFVGIETMWKPLPKFAQKPWAVRALQLVAAAANNGNGTHLLVVDADIQFNHWELSAKSLVVALLNPLLAYDHQFLEPSQIGKPPLAESTSSSDLSLSASSSSSSSPVGSAPSCAEPASATMVVLNAPRSFIADDGLVHLFTYLFVYAVLGIEIHQIYGGEFSVHRELNKALLRDKSLFYRDAYCMECQFACRAVVKCADAARTNDEADLLAAGKGKSKTSEGDHHDHDHDHDGDDDKRAHEGGVLEWLMKGKWHAKITLSKLLAIDPKTDRTRLDFVTEKLFDDALLFASLGIGADHSLHPCVTNGTGGLSKRQQPDPRQQSMRVLAPPATRKELVVASKDYYQRLLTNHLTQGAADLPLESSLVQELLPALHSRAWKPRNGREGYSLFVSKAQQSWTEEEREHHFVFGAQEWARHLMELLRIYQRSTNDRQRQAVLEANRLVWLVGATAFLNDCAPGSWGDMLDLMHKEYAPTFRAAYLREFGTQQQQ